MTNPLAHPTPELTRPQLAIPAGSLFREATDQDAPAIRLFMQERFAATFGHLYDSRDLDAFLGQFTVEDEAMRLASADFDTLVSGDGSAGLLAVAQAGPAHLPEPGNRPGDVELRRLYLADQAKGTGLAQAMMACLLEQARARQARRMVLSVFSENHRALRFYARFGFAQIGTYDFMVGDHADHEFIFARDL